MTECLVLLTALLTSSLLLTVLLTALVLTLEQMKLQKVEVFVHSFHEAGILFLELFFWHNFFGIHFWHFFYLEYIFVDIPVVDIIQILF